MSKKNKKSLHVDAHGNIVNPLEEQQEIKQSKKLEAKTEGQQRYIDTIHNHEITLCSGKFGTGKTHIAIGLAVEYLRMNKVKQIIISRPSISACNESQGFYPGNSTEKLMPFVLNVLDELRYYCTNAEIKKWTETEKFRLMPVELLRGHNWHDSFVVIDECANLTFRQVELIISRLGQRGKLVMSADFSQSDLPPHKRGGFRAFFEILAGMPQIGICHLGPEDIVRSDFLKEILRRIEEYRGPIEQFEEIKEKFIQY